jgi:hypothetical protein
MQQDNLDLFNDMIPKPKEKSKEVPSSSSFEDEIRTSYLLVNVLLSLLIDKGIIQQGEVDELLGELYEEYKRKRVK